MLKADDAMRWKKIKDVSSIHRLPFAVKVENLTSITSVYTALEERLLRVLKKLKLPVSMPLFPLLAEALFEILVWQRFMHMPLEQEQTCPSKQEKFYSTMT